MLIYNGMALDLITDFYKEALAVIVVGKKIGTMFHACVSDAWRVVRFFFKKYMWIMNRINSKFSEL